MNTDKPWIKSLPPTDREIEIDPSIYDGDTSAFYQDGYWWYVGIDDWGMERYAAGPTPEVWREKSSRARNER